MDHYRTLQVARQAEPEVIERAYRALAMKYHPDTAGRTGEDSTARMQAINTAYAVLSDPANRARYDLSLAPEGEDGWDVFMERGLIGLFVARFRKRRVR